MRRGFAPALFLANFYDMVETRTPKVYYGKMICTVALTVYWDSHLVICGSAAADNREGEKINYGRTQEKNARP